MAGLTRKFRSLRRRFRAVRREPAPNIALIWWGSLSGGGGATIGDLQAVDNLSDALTAKGCAHQIITNPSLALPHRLVPDLFDLRKKIQKIVFVCGPLVHNRELVDFLSIHRKSKKIAVGVSVVSHQRRMSELFDAVIARDGTEDPFFDIAVTEFKPPRLPEERLGKVGLCLRGPQSEYGRDTCESQKAESLLRLLISELGLKMVDIDTVIRPENRADEIIQKFRDVDMVLTTRLHGSLFGLSEGKPILAIDQIAGGAKVSSFLKKIEWPYIFQAGNTSVDELVTCIEQWEAHYPLHAITTSQAHAREAASKTIAQSVNLIAGPSP